jgi:hypothetical protein
VRLEQSFGGHYPRERRSINKTIDKEFSVAFDGVGFALRGEAKPVAQSSWDYAGPEVFTAELSIDGQKSETARLPVSFHDRRHELFWRYQLPKGKHQLHIKVLEAPKGFELKVYDLIVYGEK